eukprot:scaffold7756_cov93-Isochrysis_galbana.AAC.4
MGEGKEASPAWASARTPPPRSGWTGRRVPATGRGGWGGPPCAARRGTCSCAMESRVLCRSARRRATFADSLSMTARRLSTWPSAAGSLAAEASCQARLTLDTLRWC